MVCERKQARVCEQSCCEIKAFEEQCAQMNGDEHNWWPEVNRSTNSPFKVSREEWIRDYFTNALALANRKVKVHDFLLITFHKYIKNLRIFSSKLKCKTNEELITEVHLKLKSILIRNIMNIHNSPNGSIELQKNILSI